jgi:DNA-binding transcriptional ArsR family regulator
MFEQVLNLDTIFGSLSDPTRRDILRRLMQAELSVTDVADPYDLSLAAISKHLQNLEKSGSSASAAKASIKL